MKERSIFSFSYILRNPENSSVFLSEIDEKLKTRGFEVTDSLSYDKKMLFTSPSLFFVKHSGELLIEQTPDDCRFHVYVKPDNIYISLVVLLLLGSFLTTYSISAYLIFALIFSISFIAFSILLIRNQFMRIIDIFLLSDSVQETLSEKQKQWIKDPNLCPACGESISKYEHKCQSCGLVIKDKVNFSRFSDTNNSFTYTYDYKEK